MSDLLSQIRNAQRDVAEQLVIASLQKSGLAVKQPAPKIEPNGLPVGVHINDIDVATWIENGLKEAGPSPEVAKARQALSQITTADMFGLTGHVMENLRRKLTGYAREEAASALTDVADVCGLASDARDPAAVVSAVRELRRELDNYKVAYAESVRLELERLAPGGRLP